MALILGLTPQALRCRPFGAGPARCSPSAGPDPLGESLDVREAGEAVGTVLAQLDGSLPAHLDGEAELAVAYEPIWAIGTGKIPTVAEIAEMHSAIRGKLAEHYGDAGQQMRILYGGSVKGSNAAEIFSIAHVDGALVGGASLQAADFLPIVAAAAAVEGQGSIA